MDLELDSTSEKIVSATFKLLQKDGSEKATTKKIAAEAGVNEVTIFRKFENKKNLIEITKQYYLQVLINTLEEIFVFDDSFSALDYKTDYALRKALKEEIKVLYKKLNNN